MKFFFNYYVVKQLFESRENVHFLSPDECRVDAAHVNLLLNFSSEKGIYHIDMRKGTIQAAGWLQNYGQLLLILQSYRNYKIYKIYKTYKVYKIRES